jgi:hypothetical protein
MSRLPHKKPILFAKKALKTDNDNALVEIEFDFVPTLAMTIEAAAQAFSFIDRQNDGTWGVVAMIKDAKMHSEPKDLEYLCDVSITQSIYPYYKIEFKTITKAEELISTGELSIKIF